MNHAQRARIFRVYRLQPIWNALYRQTAFTGLFSTSVEKSRDSRASITATVRSRSSLRPLRAFLCALCGLRFFSNPAKADDERITAENEVLLTTSPFVFSRGLNFQKLSAAPRSPASQRTPDKKSPLTLRAECGFRPLHPAQRSQTP